MVDGAAGEWNRRKEQRGGMEQGEGAAQRAAQEEDGGRNALVGEKLRISLNFVREGVRTRISSWIR